MADLSAYPVQDVEAMARSLGYSMLEIDTYWTDALLEAQMRAYYTAPATAPIVNPAQAARMTPAETHWDTLAEGIGADLSAGARRAAAAVEGAARTLPASMLWVLTVGAVAILIATRRP